MRREVERMMRLRRISIVFAVLGAIVLVAMAAMGIISTIGDYSGVNDEFAEIETEAQVGTKSFNIQPADKLLFFSEGVRNERTLFLNSIPNLTIHNSDKYYVEVTANKDLLDKLEVTTVEDQIRFSFQKKYYNPVTANGRDYRGLFVDCTQFDVHVYAPITEFYTSAEINLEYNAPKCETLAISVIGEIRDGRVYGVDSNALVAGFCGASNVSFEGEVSGHSVIEVMHNSRIDASMLKTKSLSTSVSCQIYGFSYVIGQDVAEYSFTKAGFVLTVVSVVLALLFATLFIITRIMFFKQKEEIDRYVEKRKEEERYLKIPEKTEENLLQKEE